MGDTSISGFGGLVSGLDRDSLITQLVSGTQTKIDNVDKKITTAEWKQEAFRDVIDNVLSLEDTYFTYSSSTPLKSESFYAKNQITESGSDTAKESISASGSSDLLEYIHIRGVKQTATTASIVSSTKGSTSASVDTSASIWDNMEALGLSSDDYATEDDLTTALQSMQINGVTVSSSLTADSTVEDLVNAINKNDDLGVKADFMDGTNQFILFTTDTGDGQSITLGDGTSSTVYNSDGSTTTGSSTLADSLFGYSSSDGGFTDGQDAILAYDYGNGNTQTVTSDSNTFDIAGLKVTVSGTFGYDSDGELDGSTGLTFTASADVDTVTSTVKEFLEKYNEIVTDVQDAVTTEHDDDYEPLTDAQKDEMTDEEIEKWEEKAKTGILYNDTTMSGFNDALNAVINKAMANGVSYSDMEDIGITMAEDYLDGGKIEFDEEKFKTAMEEDPDKVASVLSGENGLIGTIESTLTKYATRYSSRNGGSYGILVEEAGTTELSRSTNDNALYDTIQELEDQKDSLEDLLSTEKSRYKKQFDTLETTLNTLNAQSSYLSGLTS